MKPSQTCQAPTLRHSLELLLRSRYGRSGSFSNTVSFNHGDKHSESIGAMRARAGEVCSTAAAGLFLHKSCSYASVEFLLLPLLRAHWLSKAYNNIVGNTVEQELGKRSGQVCTLVIGRFCTKLAMYFRKKQNLREKCSIPTVLLQRVNYRSSASGLRFRQSDSPRSKEHERIPSS